MTPLSAGFSEYRMVLPSAADDLPHGQILELLIPLLIDLHGIDVTVVVDDGYHFWVVVVQCFRRFGFSRKS